MTTNKEEGQGKMSSTSSVGRDGGITRVRAIVVVMLLALFLQFLVGMWLNLFATFPQLAGSSGNIMFGAMMGSMMGFMLSGGMSVFMVHMMMGLVILALAVVSLALFATSFSSEKKTSSVLLGVAGLGSIIFAGISGLYFMYSGFSNDVYSYLMAVGFILAFMAYFAELFLLRQPLTAERRIAAENLG